MKLILAVLSLALDLSSFSAAANELRGLQDEEEGDNPIVGGSTTGVISYFVHFADRSCGASLITGDMVLTAAHCVDIPGFPSSVRIAPSTSTSSSTDGTTVSVDTGNSVIHPSYNGNIGQGADVALLKLSSTVSTSTFPPVQLNSDSTRPCDGAELSIYGFGLTSASGGLSDTQQFLSTTFQCFSSSSAFIALFASSTTGACFGDSGGPAVTGNTQFGIASFVVGGCAVGNFDGYARVSTYFTWIQSQVCSRASDTTNFNCGASARMQRAVADTFSKVYFAAQNSMANVASTFGFGGGGGKYNAEKDYEWFPMGPRTST